MAFRAVHAGWGTVFAHLPDLGCGQAWEAVWKVKPLPPITCPECGHPMYAKTSRTGMRFFAHAPYAPDCEIAREGESEAHHLLKLELAWAGRDAGAHAELEVRAPDGSWRADVLARAPDGSWRTALEAQLSPITDTDIAARTERMRRHGVAVCWFSDRLRPPWLGTVPSVRVARPEGGGPLGVVEGLVRFDGRNWRRVGPTPLADFLRWVFNGQAVPHAVKSPYAYANGIRSLPVVWTHPKYIAAEAAHLAEEERRRLAYEAQAAIRKRRLDARKAAVREGNTASRARALRKAVKAEEAVRDTPAAAELREKAARRRGVRRAIAYLSREHGLTATVGWSVADPCWADGIPLVDGEGVPVAVFNPARRLLRGQAYLLLAGLLLLFGDELALKHFSRYAYGAPKRPKDQRTEVVRVDFCACETPDLVAKIEGREFPARPSDTLGAAAALYLAQCRICGGAYRLPWRRILPQEPDSTPSIWSP
ncbi:competence protein CoiA family protein [Streptomyces sp. RerS4]|uniref:competence protein CoiA n=1 Tax=Streptomyces sp. RerS4 TaxID=2942449 RepID=UPI00201BF493|nr:competence protein CoiA family protein [Streptomyces sp. RerS4]UQW99129.1 competence protein CoiA [Streptomyces sp. RerS4]